MSSRIAAQVNVIPPQPRLPTMAGSVLALAGGNALQHFVHAEDRVDLGGLVVRVRATDCLHALLESIAGSKGL
jgi:hypothetical protein